MGPIPEVTLSTEVLFPPLSVLCISDYALLSYAVLATWYMLHTLGYKVGLVHAERWAVPIPKLISRSVDTHPQVLALS